MRYLFAVLMLTVLIPPRGTAQDRTVIDRGKAASALVELDEGKTAATAFCIHKSGIFVTNHHVVAQTKPGAEIRLILDVATPTQRQVLATVIRTDADNDLALLRTTAPGEFEALRPGNSNNVFETMQTVVFGFPFGKELALKEDTLPAISVSVGRITSIRREADGIRLFQLDAEINPGNSGGAVLDNDGNVIGVVSFGVFATGVNFAIPVHHLGALLQRPDVNAEYPALTTRNLGEKHVITVAVTPLTGAAMAEPTLDVSLKHSNGESILIPMKLTADGLCHPLKRYKQSGCHSMELSRLSQRDRPRTVPFWFNGPAPITLSNHCLQCHMHDRKSTSDRIAGLVIAIPVEE